MEKDYLKDMEGFMKIVLLKESFIKNILSTSNVAQNAKLLS